MARLYDSRMRVGFRAGPGLGAVILLAAVHLAAAERVERYEPFEAAFQASGRYGNPYVEGSAEAVFRRPGGGEWKIPLYWAGGGTWKVRVSPDTPGTWSFSIASGDAGLNGRKGAFECVESRRAGGITAWERWPDHFRRQSGAPFWFLGDTAWGYFTDSAEDKHDRAAAEHYARTRAGQGFTVIHSMLLSEQGVGNRNGPPWEDIGRERLNPRYWEEVDQRLAFANRNGLTVGLALAWGNKRKVEPYSWGRFPSVDARKRYARYIAARYSAYDVYFLVSGEWHAEIRSREGASPDGVFREFVDIGGEVAEADPHQRMIGIHPMTEHGSVREFAAASWMSFADYQQNYRDLHAKLLLSRTLPGPVVNSEYGYLLRDSDGDGVPDKSNSHSSEDMRFASWDIAMAGGYLVTGFGTTYFGGHRDPGPFDVDAKKNDEWEAQIGFLKKLFSGLPWWRLAPADLLLASAAAREGDRYVTRQGQRGRDIRPPRATYWAMADPGRIYVLYARGTRQALRLQFDARPRAYRARQFNPRSGEIVELGEAAPAAFYEYTPPDEADWVLLLEAEASANTR